MKEIFKKVEKTILALAFVLMSTAGVQAQLYWSGTQNLQSGQTINDNIILNGNVTINVASGMATLNGIISGSYSVTKTGGGSLVLKGTSTYTGTTTISAGSIELGGATANGSVAGNIVNNSALIFNYGTFNKTYAGVISGTGEVIKWGSGKLTLTGTNTYTGLTSIWGTFQVGNGTRGSISNTSNVVLQSSPVGVLRFEPGDNTTFSKVISGAGRLELDGGTSNYFLYLTANNSYSGTTTVERGRVSMGNNTTTGTVGTGNVILSTTNTFIVFRRSNAYSYSGVISGSGGIDHVGPGTTTLNGVNTYTGITYISGGTLALGSSGSIEQSSQVHFFANNTILNISAGNKKIKNINTNGTTTHTGCEVILGTRTLTIGTSGGTDGSGSYAGKITGTGTVYKYGTGTLTLSGASTYSGTTYLYGGVTVFSALNNFGTSALRIYDNATLRWASGNTADISARISSGNTSLYVTFDIGANNVTFATALPTTSNIITKAGTGTLTLNVAQTYTGATYIDAGTLTLGTNGSIATSSGVTLRSNTAKFTVSSANKVIKSLSTSSTAYTGAEVILGTRVLTIGTSATTSDGGGSFAGIFSGTTGGVTKTGTATFTMSGTHTITGAFTQNAGTVNLSGRWPGNYSKVVGTTLTVTGNPTIGGNLTLAGGDINMNLNATTRSKITVTGSVTANGSNRLVITTSPISDYVLIQASSGIPNTTPYTTNNGNYYLRASGNNQLILDAASAPLTPTITTTSLPNGEVGTIYSENLTASGETPITWTHEGGVLPPGISLFQSGNVAGFPTMAGTFNFTVKASNSRGNDTRQVSITIDTIPAPPPIPPTITTYSLTNGKVNEAYSVTLTADGDAPITWELESGTLPIGLNLSLSGTISGTPTEDGTFEFTIKASNVAGNDVQDFSIVIDPNVSIKQLTIEDGQLKIYPNPTNGQLTIENDQLSIESVEIYNIVGQKLQSKIVNLQSEIGIDVSHLANGMYYLRIGEKMVKFVKE